MAATALALTERAEAASRVLPPLLVEAQRIAATVIMGVHGRKRAGPGETFWQYRPYSFGDSAQRIDWHKSARSDRVFIRENEWEAANTLWLWVSPSVSMDFRSHLSNTTKRDRAQLLALALATLGVRAHERIAALGGPFAPAPTKAALNRMAEWLLAQNAEDASAFGARLPRFSTAVLFGDFLEPPDEIAHRISRIAESGVAGHVVQIADPAEETLPYNGRVEFQEMRGPQTFIAGKTETLREAYQAKYRTQREAVRSLARRLGWTFAVHRTDEPPLKLLLSLHGLIGGSKSRVLAQGAAR